MNENRTEAIRRGLISRYDDIQCRVDNAHIGIIAMLQNAVVKKRWDWLHILPCDTKSALTKISQIEILKMIICNGLFKISEQDDNKTRVELGMIT